MTISTSFNKNTDRHGDQIHPFYASASRYASILSRENVEVRATRHPNACPIFDALPTADRSCVLDRMNFDLRIFEALKDKGEALSDSPRHLWRFLAQSGLTPCSDIFDKIEKDDVVVVYDTGFRQVFQNLRFFDYVSATLEQLFCAAWNEYSSRPAEIEQYYLEMGTNFFSGEVRETIAPTAPEHLVQEVKTELLKKFWLKVRLASPLFQDGNPAGVIAIIRCRYFEGAEG